MPEADLQVITVNEPLSEREKEVVLIIASHATLCYPP